jgi:two-component system sensor histidine kinase TctE
MSLSARMLVGLGGLLCVGGVLLALATYAYGKAAARDAFDRLLVGAASAIATSVSVVDGAPVVDIPVSAFELLALAPEDRVGYLVTGPGGEVLTGYPELAGFAARAGPDPVLFDGRFTGEPARVIRFTRRFAERSFSGEVDIVIAQTQRARDQLASSITRNALMVLAIAGIAVLVLSYLVIRSALGPLDRLAARLEARDPQDLTPIDMALPREIGVMVGALNGFMGRLDRQLGTMQRLISDTAHQLRTPVAALRAQADLAEGEDDPARLRQIVGRIHRRSVSLGRLLDQMLSRAMVIHRIDAARREVIDLRDIALGVVEGEDHHLIAPGAVVQLEIGGAPVLARADALSLGEAVKNLLFNALTHGTAPVTVGAASEGGAALIWVEDAGQGPTAEVQGQLGDRFLRNAASSGKSAGLGLSIAKSVAEAFDGRLEMTALPDGFRIAMVFPEEPPR